MSDSKLRAMVSYVVNYLYANCPENLDVMVYLIGHDERYLRQVEEITEAIIDSHDNLLVAWSNGKKVEDLAPKYAKQCGEVRQKMRQLVVKYVTENSPSS